MSIRCQIGIYQKGEEDLKDFEVLIYRHSDGYPEGVLPDILPYIKLFLKHRGWDEEYLGARLLQYMTKEHDGYMGDFEKQMSKNGIKGYSGELNSNHYSFLGYGISRYFHGDIEYFYAIYPDVVNVYKCHYSCEPKDWMLIDTINLKEEES